MTNRQIRLAMLWARVQHVIAEHGTAWMLTLAIQYVCATGSLTVHLLTCLPVAAHTAEHMLRD